MAAKDFPPFGDFGTLLGDDTELAEALDSVLDAHDSERSIEALTAALVHFLEEGGSLTDDLVLSAAQDWQSSLRFRRLFLSCVQRRCGWAPRPLRNCLAVS